RYVCAYPYSSVAPILILLAPEQEAPRARLSERVDHERHRDDPGVEGQRLPLCVAPIQREPLGGRSRRELGEAGEAGRERPARRGVIVEPAVAQRVLARHRSRPDGAEIAAQDVEELRQLVEAGRAQQPSRARHALVAHGAELEDLERLLQTPEPPLPEEQRPSVIEEDGGGDAHHQRPEEQQSAHRADYVERAFRTLHPFTLAEITLQCKVMPHARPLRVKFILPALTEATSPYWRPIKYSLFPPLGLATLAAYLTSDDEAVIVDEHVERLTTDDEPDLVVIQVYITNAYRAYRLADHYRARGVFVALGGLHVTSLPDEAAPHADAIFIGPGEQTFPQFLRDFRQGRAQPIYRSTAVRSIEEIPPVRRDLIQRRRYVVPNSIVVSGGC